MKSSQASFVTYWIKLPQVILSIVVNETLTPKSTKIRVIRRVTLDELIWGFVQDRTGHDSINEVAGSVDSLSPTGWSKAA